MLGAAGGGDLAWVLSNHDFPRVASRWGSRAAPAAAILLLTLPGCAFLYQGDEIGMLDGPGGQPPLDRFGRDRHRHPMQWDATPAGGFSSGDPWLPLTDPADRNVAGQRREPSSLLNLHRRLIALRRELGGPLEQIEAERGLLSYRRGAHRVLLNTGEQSVEPGSLGAGRVELSSAGPGEAAGDRIGAGEGRILRTGA